MVDFYIFRHGETDINKQKRWQGSGTDVDLNETGRAQAACLFDKLKDKKLEIIYSSPLIRAYHTAQIAAKPLGIEVVKFPDLRAIKLLAKLRNRKDDTIMLAIVDELAKDGLEVVDQTLYLKDLMPAIGVLSRRKPTEGEEDDIRFGFVTAKAMGGMDIGQTVVVKHKAVMAVEAIEGTDACIRRGGALGREKSVVVKVAKPNQDPRFDVPAVGRQTILSMIESNCNVLAMEAGRTLFVEQDEVLRLADSHGIVICAVDKNF